MIEIIILYVVGLAMLAGVAYYDYKNVPTGQNLF